MSYKEIKSFEQECREKDAEILRLKELITECADALEEEFGESRDLMQSQQRPWNLLQRAREVTHGR
jgi:hypothetical protein